MLENELAHYGILGMKWGVRKERKAAERVEKKDLKWIKKNQNKIESKTRRAISKELNEALKGELNPNAPSARLSTGKVSKSYMNQYNQKLATLMNQAVGDLRAPSGKVVRYIAKRGELGVHTALADAEYDMNQVRNGVNSAGRIAYRQETLKKG